jgi:hypothetical protein
LGLSRVDPHFFGDDCLGSAMALQGLLQKRQSGRFIPPIRDVALENFTFMIDRAPKVMLLPVDVGYAALRVTNTSSKCQGL